jgi:CspA family cold shock protein
VQATLLAEYPLRWASICGAFRRLCPVQGMALVTFRRLYWHSMVVICLHVCNFARYLEHMPQGTVKFFNDDKGFGFITPDEGTKDVFVHVNSCNGDIAENDVVTYEVEETPKGLSAVKVSVV